jgi:hypothetical protein
MMMHFKTVDLQQMMTSAARAGLADEFSYNNY